MVPMLCLGVLLSAGAAAPVVAGPSAILYARELADGGIAAATPGEYHFWVWAAPGGTATLTVGGRALEAAVPRQEKQERGQEAMWAYAGALKLDREAAAVKLDGAWAVALSARRDYDPALVMADMRAVEGPRAVDDRRVRQLRHTDTVFMMPQYRSLEEWTAKADGIRRRMLLSSGLVPEPEKTPLNPQLSGLIDHGDYTVEKAAFEVVPGFFCTGNLYRPKGDGPFPAIVNPHGHWQSGRLEDSEMCSVPARCITFAKMGAVAFTYDMVGYNDSRQFVHRWGGEREKLWGVHPFALQLLTSIRAVDFVSGLPGVDPARIGCTGASGGGTQTFALYTADPRIAAAAPVNMISSTMQGGCVCENAPLIRYSNSNMEIGAMMAPKPLLMVAATGDWTRETPRVEYPAIRSVYALYGAEAKVESVQFDYGHNYNKDSREAVYRFFGRHLIDPNRDWTGFTEPEHRKDPDEALRVFPGEGPMEGYKSMGQQEVIDGFIARNKAKWDAVLPADAGGVKAFQEQYGTVLADVLGVAPPDPNGLRCERAGRAAEREGCMAERWVISRVAQGDAVPAVLFRGRDNTPQDAVILVHGAGKAALIDPEKGGPGPLAAALAAKGKAVLVIDPFLAGDHQPPAESRSRDAMKVGVFPFLDTFEPTDAACRVQDVLTAAAFLRARRDMTGRIELAGLGGAGVACLLAAAVDPGIAAVAADLENFPLDDDDAWVRDNYIPCIRSVGDARTAAAMIAPRPLTLWNVNGAEGIGRYGAKLLSGAPAPGDMLP